MRSTEPNYKPPLGAWLDLEHPLSRGLVARWLINEGAGDVFGSVAGLRAVNNGAVWRPRTVGGLAVQFDGSSAFMQVAHSRIMAPATGLTLAVRLRRGDTGRRQIVLGKGDGNGPSDTQYWIEFTSSDQLAFHCSDGSTENRFVSSLILSDTSNLHTIVCTWDGATQRVWLDGVESSTTGTLSGSVGQGAQTFSFGRLGGLNGLYYNGDLYDFCLYSRAQAPEFAREYSQRLYANVLQANPRRHWFLTPAATPRRRVWMVM
jgi:hypothetical protein